MDKPLNIFIKTQSGLQLLSYTNKENIFSIKFSHLICQLLRNFSTIQLIVISLNQWRIQDFPEEGAPTLKGGANIRFCQNFPKTA